MNILLDFDQELQKYIEFLFEKDCPEMYSKLLAAMVQQNNYLSYLEGRLGCWDDKDCQKIRESYVRKRL